jgi:hypothetical protein
VRKLERPEKVEWMLSFDFDGTLHHPGDDPPVASGFFELIERLRAGHGALWMVNTGRSMGHFVEGLVASRFPFLPDVAVVRESEIFVPNEVGRWIPVQPWNRECEKKQQKFFRRAKRTLGKFREMVERETGAEWIRHDGEPAGIIARSDEEMDWICEQLGPVAEELPDLGWQRNTIYLRFSHRDFHKGSALVEVARLEGVPSERCFAIGDGHNDLQMLDPEVAGEFACPANSVEEVKRAVLERGGRVMECEHSAGVVEALLGVFGGR